MFGSQILDVGIGLSLVFLLLSLLCSSLAEIVARAFRARAFFLRRGLLNLLDTEDKQVKEFLEHPLLKGFRDQVSLGFGLRGATGASALDSQSFALALTAELTEVEEGQPEPTVDSVRKELRKRIRADGNTSCQEALLALLQESKGSLDTWRERIARWFESSMQQASYAYKRFIQLLVAAAAIATVWSLDLDATRMARVLWEDTASRDAMAVLAVSTEQELSGFLESGPAEVDTAALQGNLDRLHELRDELSRSRFFELMAGAEAADGASGPSAAAVPESGWFQHLCGVLITVFAVTVGAPFWFDTLHLLLGLRGRRRRAEGAAGGAASG